MVQTKTLPAMNIGALVFDDAIEFRVWAPKCKSVQVIVERDPQVVLELEGDRRGYFSARTTEARPGDLYRYQLDRQKTYPDPASRFQPDGPHGSSQIVDPRAYRWKDAGWPGVKMPGQVMYELHVGTFTREGTFDAAARELRELQRLGVTLIEVMPVAECPGRWNWGYDGVDLFAPSHNYGDPEAFKRFVDAAHELGLGVILDVVYNHVGPDGNYLPSFSDDYFTDRYHTDWGKPINYDGPQSKEVRQFFIQNACYWIEEFHLDGLRLDATQNIYDSSSPHILAEISQRTRAIAGSRSIVLVAENETQDVRCITPVEKGGFGLDGMWNDDFHHSARVALTGRREAYYTDYYGTPQELISALKRGFLYQGQYYRWQKQPRGTSVTDQPGNAFVLFLQNHDQVANSLRGQRVSTQASPGRYRAMTALLLLAPGTPLLFMGQEFGSTSPFPFFADHQNDALIDAVRKGRGEFLSQFPSSRSPAAQEAIPAAEDPETFKQACLDFRQRDTHAPIYRFHEDLLRLRREDRVVAQQDRFRLEGAVLDAHGLVLRFFGDDGDDRLLLINLGRELLEVSIPEPLLAPPGGRRWKLTWSSDNPAYGGPGPIDPFSYADWRLSAETALFYSTEHL